MTWKQIKTSSFLDSLRFKDGTWNLRCESCKEQTKVNEAAELIGGPVCRSCGSDQVVILNPSN